MVLAVEHGEDALAGGADHVELVAAPRQCALYESRAEFAALRPDLGLAVQLGDDGGVGEQSGQVLGVDGGLASVRARSA